MRLLRTFLLLFVCAASPAAAGPFEDGFAANVDAVTGRDLVAAKMTPAQIAQAQKLAREWNPRR